MARRELSIANLHPRLRIDRRAIAALLHLLDALPGERRVPPGELSVVFLEDAELAKLHGEFLADRSKTDVITFEGDLQAGMAGEICVSADAAATYARKHGQDFSRELTLYLVHGWLHLAGYDDLVPIKKRAMRGAESRAMRLLDQHSAIPRFTLRPRRSRASMGTG